jgi:BirA family biotin operon repressor/biotin-[acetyl-CoA-carboxylase] ligase
VGNKKIAGILIENSISGNSILSSVIGIGLNVNQLEFNGLNATSIQQIKMEHFSIKDILMSLLDNFNFQYDAILRHSFDLLQKKYEAILFRKDILSDFSDQSRTFKGIVLGVNESGQLRVQVDEQIRNYNLKEIEFIL